VHLFSNSFEVHLTMMRDNKPRGFPASAAYPFDHWGRWSGGFFHALIVLYQEPANSDDSQNGQRAGSAAPQPAFATFDPLQLEMAGAGLFVCGLPITTTIAQLRPRLWAAWMLRCCAAMRLGGIVPRAFDAVRPCGLAACEPKVSCPDARLGCRHGLDSTPAGAMNRARKQEKC